MNEGFPITFHFPAHDREDGEVFITESVYFLPRNGEFVEFWGDQIKGKFKVHNVEHTFNARKRHPDFREDTEQFNVYHSVYLDPVSPKWFVFLDGKRVAGSAT